MIPNKDIKVIPKNQYKEILKLFENIYEDFIIDQDVIKKKYYLQAFNIIKKEILNLFTSKLFWKLYSLSTKCCEHIYGYNSKYCGEICGRTIELKFDGYNYKCSRHIGVKHIPISNNIPNDKKCKGFTKYNKPCKRRSTNGNFCIYHCNKELLKKVDVFEKERFHKDIKEIIEKGVDVDCIYNIINNIKENKILLNQEIDILSNIEYNNSFYLEKIDEIDIRYNNGICIEQYNNMFICDNKAEIGEDICINHIEEQKSIDSDININYVDIILEDVYENINELNNVKKDNLEFIDKCKKIECNKNLESVKNKLIINSNNHIKVITNILENSTYINISYLMEILNKYNIKLKELIKELQKDFPKYYKRIKGYFEIFMEDIEIDIIRKIEIAKINSVFL